MRSKYISIVRHKKGINKPKIYEVNIEKRGDDIYNFIKGEEIKNNVDNVISEKNKLIIEDKIGYDYEKYFLIIEYDIPLFKDEFEKYADLFEFMYVPGLNEIYDLRQDINNINRQISKNNNFYFKKVLPLIKMNIKFSLLIFAIDNFENHIYIQFLNEYLNKKYNIENDKNQIDNYKSKTYRSKENEKEEKEKEKE